MALSTMSATASLAAGIPTSRLMWRTLLLHRGIRKTCLGAEERGKLAEKVGNVMKAIFNGEKWDVGVWEFAVENCARTLPGRELALEVTGQLLESSSHPD